MIEEPYTLGKIGEIAEKFEDIRDYLNVKIVLFPIDQIPIILEAIVNNNKNLLKIYFTLGYFGVKNQLEDDLKKDLIAQMNNFMQWSRKEIRNHNRIMKLLDLGQFYAQNNDIRESMRCSEEVLRIDPNNRIALIAKAVLLKQLGDLNLSNQFLTKYQNIKSNPEKLSTPKLPSIEFEDIIDKIEDSQINMEKVKNREVYKKICGDSYGVLDIVIESISFMGKVFQDKNSKTTIEELRILVNDLLFLLSEWLTFISGAVYYIMEHGFGSAEQIELVINALMKTIGYDSHKNIEDIDKNFFIEYEKQRDLSEIHRLEKESMISTQIRHNNYGDLIDIDFGYYKGGRIQFYLVVDYEREELRRKMIKPKQKVVKAKKISIIFGYPLSKIVRIEHENKKGFTRMDLFKDIYEGYRKIYDEEEAEVGDPGTWKYAMNRGRSYGKHGIWNYYIEDLVIERVSYSPSKKTIEMFIGS